MAQVARPISELSRTAGTWGLSSGTDIGAMLDEVIGDVGTTQFLTPNTAAEHRVDVLLGNNWDGNPLRDPGVDTGVTLVIHTQLWAGTVTDYIVELIEEVSGVWTVRHSSNFGALGGAGTFVQHILNATEAEIAPINWSNRLGVRIRGTCAAGAQWGGTQVVFIAPDAGMNGVLRRGRIIEDFTALTSIQQLPGYWVLMVNEGGTMMSPPLGTGGSVDGPSADVTARILVCLKYDLIADQKATITLHPDYTLAKVWTGAFVRMRARDAVSPDTVCERYNLVTNDGSSAHEIKHDGIAGSPVLASTAFASIPAPVGGDTYGTSAVGSAVVGYKNGTVIAAATNSDHAGPGYPGFVVLPVAGGSPWRGVTRFEAQTIPLAGTRFSPLRRVLRRRNPTTR